MRNTVRLHISQLPKPSQHNKELSIKSQSLEHIPQLKEVKTCFLFCHFLSRGTDEFYCCWNLLLIASANISQKMSVQGFCQLVVRKGQPCCAVGLCVRGVRLLSSPLQGDQELLQKPAQNTHEQ